MKNLLLTLFCSTVLSGIVYTQTTISNCQADSALYAGIDTIITGMVTRQHRFLRNNKELEVFLDRSDQVCAIKNFAFVFDNIFNRGLDVSKRLPKPTPRTNNRISLDSVTNAAYRKMDQNSSQSSYDLFFLFIDIKATYEKEMFQSGSLGASKEQIEKLTQYGTWRYPERVRDVLLLNYKHVTKEKFYADMRYYNLRE